MRQAVHKFRLARHLNRFPAVVHQVIPIAVCYRGLYQWQFVPKQVDGYNVARRFPVTLHIGGVCILPGYVFPESKQLCLQPNFLQLDKHGLFASLHDVPVSIHLLVCYGRLEVETVDGVVAIRLPVRHRVGILLRGERDLRHVALKQSGD